MFAIYHMLPGTYVPGSLQLCFGVQKEKHTRNSAGTRNETKAELDTVTKIENSCMQATGGVCPSRVIDPFLILYVVLVSVAAWKFLKSYTNTK